MNRNRKRKPASTAVLIIALVILAIAVIRLWSIMSDYRNARDTYDKIAEEFTDVPDDTYPNIEPAQNEAWKDVYIDFAALQAINPDVIGWIRFDDTGVINVDYPVMCGTEDNKYLRADMYGDYCYSGSIFLEWLNSSDFSDPYTIIYGHNMRDGSMFGTLRKFRDDEEVYEANKYFTIYTPRGAKRYEIFAYENVKEDSIVFTAGYEHNEEFGEFINNLRSLSMRDTGIVPSSVNDIVTLSTCTSAGETYRFVMHAVLIDEIFY